MKKMSIPGFYVYKKRIFLFFLAFYLISYVAKIGDYFSFSHVITPLIFLCLVFTVFFIKKQSVKIGFFDILLFVLAFYSMFSTFFYSVEKFHVMYLIQFILLAIGSYFFVRFVSFTSNDLLELFRFIIVIYLCAICFVLILIPVAELFDSNARFGGNVFNPVGLGYLSLLVFVISFSFLVFFPKDLWMWFFSIAAMLASLIVLFLSGSRGPFGVAMVVLLLLFTRALIHDLPILKKGFLIVIIVLSSLIIFYFDLFNGLRVFHIAVNDSVEERFILYEEAYNMIAEFPIIGSGFYGFVHEGYGYPHNIFLEFILYFGFLGYFLSFGVFIGFIYLALKILFSKNLFQVAIFAIIFALLAPKLVSTSITMSKELLIFLSIYISNKKLFEKRG
jgi:O-antigen ligase